MRLLFSALLLLIGAIATHAQVPQIERIDIQKSGIYQGDVVAKIELKDSPIGTVDILKNPTIVEETTTVAAKVGVRFGTQYLVVGTPKGAGVPLKFVIVFPEQGLRQPGTPEPIYQNDYVANRKIGDSRYQGYTFEFDWELVPGVWKFQIWHESRKLAEQAFTVTRSP